MLVLLGFLAVLGVVVSLLAHTHAAARWGAHYERQRLAKMALRNPAAFYLEVLNLQNTLLSNQLTRQLRKTH